MENIREQIANALLTTIDPACDHCIVSDAEHCKEDGHFFCQEQVRVILSILSESVKTDRKAIQDLYQTKDGDIVIPAKDWQSIQRSG